MLQTRSINFNGDYNIVTTFHSVKINKQSETSEKTRESRTNLLTNCIHK